MKARLIKRIDNGWPVYSLRREDGRLIATTRWPFDEPSLMISKNAGIELQKLSHENCDELFGVINAEKLAIEHSESELSMYPETSSTLTESEVLRLRSLIQAHSYRGFEKGFNKAMELSKDKQFTLEDMKRAISFGQGMDLWKEEEQVDKFIQSRQQPTEIEVEIEMEEEFIFDPAMGISQGHYLNKPKLDSNGCLILQKSNKEE
jgi:hypothetical protein